MTSQGSDKLKAILAAAGARARAAQATATAAAGEAAAETSRPEALLDRNEALPDSRALARLYRNNELVERLPEDEEHPVAPISTAAPPAIPATRAPSAPGHDRAEPGHPPLSPAQIRDVMTELEARFPSRSYRTFEAKPLPEDVIPMPPDEGDGEAVQETNQPFYILGAILALAVIGVFVYLALNGQLQRHPPTGGATPAPSVSAHR